LTDVPTKSIVVVEDDAAMAKAIERLLRAGGYHAVLFSSAEQMLEATDADRASCLVLDIHLPGISGLQLWRQLISMGCTSPVIFITAHDDASSREEAERLGCAAYFPKPFEGRGLLQAIRQAVLTH
jgi:FixJ family two-component response regulator